MLCSADEHNTINVLFSGNEGVTFHIKIFDRNCFIITMRQIRKILNLGIGVKTTDFGV